MQTTDSSERIALDRDHVIHLDDDLGVAAVTVGEGFWAHVPADHPELSQGRILSVFDYTSTWNYWERHPVGEELVHLLSGDVELVLDHSGTRRAIRLTAGESAIVPEGAWHRAAIHTPSRLLFVTPTPARTEQRPAAPEDLPR